MLLLQSKSSASLKIEEGMMDCDLLLSWMTHIREGSWVSFRNAVKAVAEPDVELVDLCRMLRIRLSDLCFADFFIENSQQWITKPPLLAGIVIQGCAAFLCGGRTPLIVESLKNAAQQYGCRLESEELQNCPSLIRVLGEIDNLSALAGHIGLPFELNHAARIAERATSISDKLEQAPEESAPLNWKVQSLDFKTRSWVDGLLQNTACIYTPTYGRPKHFLHKRRAKLLRMSKRESVYAAAFLKRIQLIEYNITTMQLSTPLFAPLPELCSRAACLSSGRPAEVDNGRIIYKHVAVDVAALIMVAAGQPHPGFVAMDEGGR